MKKTPSMDAWLSEAKQHPDAACCGMYLFHNGVVRETAKALAREGRQDTLPVRGMVFSYDADGVDEAVRETLQREGIFYARVWLNEGELETGDDLMLVLIGGDIRPRVVEALQFLVGKLKNECVNEKEIYEE